MTRNNFLKSVGIIMGLAAINPTKLFAKEKYTATKGDIVPLIEKEDIYTINYTDGKIAKLPENIKYVNFHARSKPYGKMWTVEGVDNYHTTYYTVADDKER